MLKALREKRLQELRKERKLVENAGPRLTSETVPDKAVNIKLKQKAKVYAESLRAELLSAPSSNEKSQELTEKRTEFNLSKYTFHEPSSSLNEAFEQIFGLDDLFHSGEIENPEALLSIMPERKFESNKKIWNEFKLGSSVLGYSLPKVNSSKNDLPPLPPALISIQQQPTRKDQMEQKHGKNPLGYAKILNLEQREKSASG